MRYTHKKIILSWAFIITACLIFSSNNLALGERQHYLIYKNPNSVIIFDADDLKAIKEIPFTAKNVAKCGLSLDRKYLAIADIGGVSAWSGKPKNQGKVIIIDMEAQETKATLDVGWMPIQFFYSPLKNYLYVINYGKGSDKPAEYNSTISVINLESMSVEDTITPNAKIEFVTFIPNGDYLYIMTLGDKKKEKKPSQLMYINTETNQIENTIELNWQARHLFLDENHELLYLLCAGIPKDKREEYVEGSLHIVDLPSKSEIKELNVGCDPLRLIYDDAKELIFILSHKSPLTPQKKVGTLYTVSGQDIISEVTLEKEPYVLRSDEERNNYYVACKGKLLVLDSDCTQVLQKIHFDQGKAFKDLVIAPDNSKGYFVQYNTTHVKAFDLSKDIRVARDINVGRSGIKIGKFLGAMALTAAGAMASQAVAMRTGAAYYTYPVYTVAPPSTDLIISPNYKYTYVYNTQTNDITILDFKTDAILRYEKPLDGGGKILLTTEDQKKLIFLADKSYKIIDLEDNTIIEEKKFAPADNPPVYNMFIAPFENEIYLSRKNGFYIFCCDKVKILKHEKMQGSLASVIFELMPGEDLTKQAEACLNRGKYDRAEKLLQVHLNKNPDDTLAHFLLALAKEGHEDFEEAIAEYKATLKLDPNFVEAYTRLGELYLHKEESELALDCFLQAASIFEKGEDYKNAIDCYKKASLLREDNEEVLIKLVECYEKENLNIEAIDTYQQLLNLNQENEDILLSQAVLLIKENQIDRAEINLQVLLSLNPENQLAHHYYATIHALRDETEKAQKSLQKSIELNPEYIPSYVQLGTVHLKSENPDEAIIHFRKAIELGARDYNVFYNLGHLYLNKEEFKEAENFLMEAALISFQQEDYQKAEENFKIIAEIDPENPFPHGYLARIYHQKEMNQAALDELMTYLTAEEIDWQIISPLVNNLTAESEEEYQALGLESIPDSVEALEMPIHLSGTNIPQIVSEAEFEFPEGMDKTQLGIHIFNLTVDKRGKVEEVIPVRTNEEVEEVITSSLKKWVFQVTLLNGEPVKARFTKPIDFSKEE
jgi:superkiller protein 3